MAHSWVRAHPGSFPPNAIRGGTDSDGEPIFIGRAYHEDQLVPAKVLPGKNAAYVAFGGQEHFKDTYEVLCQHSFDWVPTSGSSIPPGAIEGGYTGSEPLFIGRVFHEGSQTVGKVQPSHGACYISYDGNELPFSDYEILVLHH